MFYVICYAYIWVVEWGLVPGHSCLLQVSTCPGQQRRAQEVPLIGLGQGGLCLGAALVTGGRGGGEGNGIISVSMTFRRREWAASARRRGGWETDLFRQKPHFLFNEADHLLALATVLLRIAPCHVFLIRLLDLDNDCRELLGEIRRRRRGGVLFTGLADPAPERGENQLPLLKQVCVGESLEAGGGGEQGREHAQLGGEQLHLPVVLQHQLPVRVLQQSQGLRRGCALPPTWDDVVCCDSDCVNNMNKQQQNTLLFVISRSDNSVVAGWLAVP